MQKSMISNGIKIEQKEEENAETIVGDTFTENANGEAYGTGIEIAAIKIEPEQSERYEIIDLPDFEQMSATTSQIDAKWSRQRSKKSAEYPESSSKERYLETACQVLLSNITNYKPDVEAFGELIKAELDQIEDPDKCQAMRFKIMKILMDEAA